MWAASGLPDRVSTLDRVVWDHRFLVVDRSCHSTDGDRHSSLRRIVHDYVGREDGRYQPGRVPMK